MRFLPSLSAAWWLLGSSVLTAHAAIDKINAVGSKFFYDNGSQYYMKGEIFALHREYILTVQASRINSFLKTLSSTRSSANATSLV